MTSWFPGCYFAQHATDPKLLDSCYGRIDPCHIVSQQAIKREHSRANPRTPTAWHCPSPLTGTDLDDLLRDHRNIVPGCRRHHAQADNLGLDYAIPESARAFASAYELSHFLPAREARAA